jgi:hypothetical protein
MYLKRRKASTDPRLRSLLQKAVRRGFSSIVERVVRSLDAIGDSTWLRSRAVVITFEECWLLGSRLRLDRNVASKLDILAAVARSTKQKDAAGLGALAHAFREGDGSMLALVPDQRSLRIVAEALERPDDFFRWVANESQSYDSARVIAAARAYLPVATWEWDKACILAGALCAAHYGTRPVDVAGPTPQGDFPYWVALDKHTDEGKAVLRQVAREMKVGYRQLIWTSFYCESARVNDLLISPWFEAEREWRLARAKLSYEQAQNLWSRAKGLVRERLEVKATELKSFVESGHTEWSI